MVLSRRKKLKVNLDDLELLLLKSDPAFFKTKDDKRHTKGKRKKIQLLSLVHTFPCSLTSSAHGLIGHFKTWKTFAKVGPFETLFLAAFLAHGVITMGQLKLCQDL